MTQKQKLIDAFHINPCSLKYMQITQVLEYYGFVIIPAKGSHVKFKHPQLPTDLIIPMHNGDCKDFYKKAALKAVTNLNEQ